MKNSSPNGTLRYPVAHGIALIMLLGAATAYAQEENLMEDIYEMDPFVVPSNTADGYSPEYSNSATLISLQRDRIPFLTTVVTDSLIDDIAITNLADLSGLVSGMSVDTNPAIADEQGQPNQAFRVRGFLSQPLYNGFQTGGRISSVDNIGRVEISKGPNSVLYGQSSGGGIVNIIPKYARFDSAHAKVEVGAGNLDYGRARFDIGGPLATEKVGKVAFRLGGGWTEYSREQVFFKSEAATLSSALTWILTSNIKLDINAEYQDLKIIPSRTAAFVTTGSGVDRVVDPFNRLRNDRNFSYTGPYTKNNFETAIASAYLTAKLVDSLTLRVGGFWSQQTEDSLRYVGAYGLATNESASSPFEKRDSLDTMRGIKLDLLHSMEVSGFTFDSLIGYEQYQQNIKLGAIRTAAFPVTIPFSRRTIVSDWPKPPALNEFTNLRTDTRTKSDIKNIRFSQIVTTNDGKGTLLWGVAYGEGESRITNNLIAAADTQKGDDITYTFGISYRILERDTVAMTLFGNYSTSFLIQAGNQQNPEDFRGFATVDALRDFVNNVQPNSMDPEKGEGFEVGARFAFKERNLNLTLTYFDQSRTNIGRTFFVRENYVAGVDSEAVLATFFLASGEENSKGLEIDLNWKPTNSLEFIFGATLSDGKVVSNISAPGEVGLGLVRSPETMLNGWVKYRFMEGPLSGLSLGLGANYSDSTRILPSLNDQYRVSDYYTDVQAMARYEFQIGDLMHSVSLNVRNLLDDEWVDEANWLSNPMLVRVHYGLSW